MTATVFYQGASELAVLSNQFTAGGTPADPDAVSLVVTDPQGAITSLAYPASISRSGTGAYSAQVACATSAGLWSYVWIGAGAGGDVAPGTWRVFNTTPAQYYTSREELKDRLNIPDDSDDLAIELAVRAAARYIEKRTGRFFWQIAETRTFVPQGIYSLRISDLVTCTSLLTDPDGDGTFPVTWTQGTDFELSYGYREYNQNVSGEPTPYREVHVIGGGSRFFPYAWCLTRQDRIKITGTWGWPAVPDMITTASLLLASDLYKLKDAPFGISGSADFGQMRVQAGSQVEAMLASYCDSTRKPGV